MEALEHPSYHGYMTKQEAEARLNQFRVNCYLTRYNDTKRSYILSVLTGAKGVSSAREIFHFEIKVTVDMDKKYEIEGTGLEFTSVSELLSFYETDSLNIRIKKIGRCIKKELPE